jgi:WD40 repeat protein
MLLSGHYTVTCVQFNPSNEDYFMTGSIDGIVRIWDITSSRVVTWIETKEILTTICFHPDGRVTIIWLISFYSLLKVFVNKFFFIFFVLTFWFLFTFIIRKRWWVQ